MSYLIYVTRADHAFDTKAHPILEAEWMAVATTDPSLRQDFEQSYSRSTANGEDELLHPWVWSKHPEGEEIHFWFEDGALNSKNADEYTIEKMYELALQLNAKVLDEDDHVYDPSEAESEIDFVEEVPVFDSKSADRPASSVEVRTDKKPWWRSLFGK